MTAPVPHPSSEHGPPTVLGGRYELRGLIGRGGMAEVYRAHDAELDRTVAIKVLPSEHRGDPEYAARLRDEARAAAALNHPGVVSVFDVGVAGREVFVVMERVEGRTLRDDLRSRGRLGPSEAAAVLAAVAEALAAAHERGIVHRDVNPGNVMLCDDGRVKLMDFGIAKVVDVGGAADVGGFTGTGVVIGTAAYLSPEQVRCEPVDGRSDVYALGCSLYELVTGEVPFTGPSPVEVASRRLRESPVPPSTLVPTVPPRLDEVILRALAVDPAARPDARALAADLRAVPGSAGPPADPGARGKAATKPVGGTDRGTGPGGAPDPGEAEPWPLVRRVGVALIVLAVAALVVAVVVLALRP